MQNKLGIVFTAFVLILLFQNCSSQSGDPSGAIRTSPPALMAVVQANSGAPQIPTSEPNTVDGQPNPDNVTLACPSAAAPYADQSAALNQLLLSACAVDDGSCSKTVTVNLKACDYYFTNAGSEHILIQRKKNLILQTAVSASRPATLIMIDPVQQSIIAPPTPVAGVNTSNAHRTVMEAAANFQHVDGITILGSTLVQLSGFNIYYRSPVIDSSNPITPTSIPSQYMKYFDYGTVLSSTSKSAVIGVDAADQLYFDPTFRDISGVGSNGEYLRSQFMPEYSDSGVPTGVVINYDSATSPTKVVSITIPQGDWSVGQRVKFNHANHAGGRSVRVDLDKGGGTLLPVRPSNISIVGLRFANIPDNQVLVHSADGGILVSGITVSELDSGYHNSGNGGSIIIGDAGSGIVITNNYLKDIGDDGMNLKPDDRQVTGLVPPAAGGYWAISTSTADAPIYQPGRQVCLYNQDFSYVSFGGGQACFTVQSWNSKTGLLYVTENLSGLDGANTILVNEQTIPSNITISGNTVLNNRARGTIMSGVRNAVVSGNTYQGCSSGGVWLQNENAAFLQGAFAQNVQIVNNQISYTGAHLRGCAGILVSSELNYVVDSNYSADTIAIADNNLSETTMTPGIVVSSASNFSVTSNQLAKTSLNFSQLISLSPEWRTFTSVSPLMLFDSCGDSVSGNTFGGIAGQTFTTGLSSLAPLEQCP